jgi:hypothetical protein
MVRKLSDFDFMLTTVDTYINVENEIQRKQFVNEYSLDFIKKMTFENYILGQDNRDNFCYQIETGLRPLGSIQGATASKFGMYYSLKEQKIKISKKWNIDNDENKSFDKIRSNILKLLSDGKVNDRQAIIDNNISEMLKYKILSIYLPTQ